MRKANLIVTALAVAVSVSSGCSGASSEPTVPANETDDGPGPRETALPNHSPGGEMIPGLSVPKISSLDDKENLPTKQASQMDRNDITRRAREAMEAERFDEAVSFGDVLLIMFPGDPEAMELRGRGLIRQGDEEAGRQDLSRCCEAGRKSCCE